VGAVKQHFYDSKKLRNTIRDISVGSKTKKDNNTSMNTIFLQETLQPLGFNNGKITIK
jgi:hypothetical protein